MHARTHRLKLDLRYQCRIIALLDDVTKPACRSFFRIQNGALCRIYGNEVHSLVSAEEYSIMDDAWVWGARGHGKREEGWPSSYGTSSPRFPLHHHHPPPLLHPLALTSVQPFSSLTSSWSSSEWPVLYTNWRSHRQEDQGGTFLYTEGFLMHPVHASNNGPFIGLRPSQFRWISSADDSSDKSSCTTVYGYRVHVCTNPRVHGEEAGALVLYII